MNSEQPTRDYDAELAALLEVHKANNALVIDVEAYALAANPPTTVVTRWITSEAPPTADGGKNADS